MSESSSSVNSFTNGKLFRIRFFIDSAQNLIFFLNTCTLSMASKTVSAFPSSERLKSFSFSKNDC